MAVLLMLAYAVPVFGIFALAGFALQRRSRGALQLRKARQEADDDAEVDSLIEQLASAPRPIPDLTPRAETPRRHSSPDISTRLRLAKGSTPPYGVPELSAPPLVAARRPITQVVDPLDDTGEMEAIEPMTEEITVFVDPSLFEDNSHN